MPELPDVEVFRKYCDFTVFKKKIEKISIKDYRVLKVSESRLRRHLKDNMFEAHQGTENIFF